MTITHTRRPNDLPRKQIALALQGGGMHGAFVIGEDGARVGRGKSGESGDAGGFKKIASGPVVVEIIHMSSHS